MEELDPDAVEYWQITQSSQIPSFGPRGNTPPPDPEELAVQVLNPKGGKLIDFGDDDTTTPSSPEPPRGPAAQGRQSAPHRAIGRPDRSTSAGVVSGDVQGKIKWRNGLPPDRVVRLHDHLGRYHRAFETWVNDLSRSGPFFSVPPEVAFAQISSRSDAFVKRSETSDRELLLWGEPQQVNAAGALIGTITNRRSDNILVARSEQWKRPGSHWPAMAAQEEIEKSHDSERDRLRKKLSEIQIVSKAHCAWPSGGPLLHQALGKELEKLDSIRAKFNVHMYLAELPDDCIEIASSKPIDFQPIIAEVLTLHKEAVAKFDAHIKAYMVKYPPIVGGVKLNQEKQCSRPFLHATARAQTTVLKAQLAEHQEKNNRMMIDSIRSSLSTIHLFKGQLRMQVHFGTFVLDKFRKLKAFEFAYDFEGFGEMLRDERAKGRLIPRLKLDWEELLDRCSKADNLELVGSKNPFASLREADPSYSALFEFAGSDKTPLRLETSFKKIPGCPELEASNGRWFKVRSKSERNPHQLPLQIGVIDFMKSDWQIDIDVFEPIDRGDSKITSEMETFASTVMLEMKSRSLSPGITWPAPRANLPNNAPVSRFIEKGALQLRVRETGLILELARFTEFKRFPGSTSQWIRAPIVSWNATLFNPTWNRLLNSKTKFDASNYEEHDRGLTAFFLPSCATSEPEPNHGFWEFIEVVEKISTLLKPSEETRDAKVEKNMEGMFNVDLGMLF